jgi:hypothetical protein
VQVGEPERIAGQPSERGSPRGRQQYADQTGDCRDEHTLGHELAHLVGPAGTKGGAHGKLVPPRNELRDDHARYVGAGHDQHQRPDEPQDRQEHAHVEAGGLDERQHLGTDAFVRCRVLRLQLPGNRLEIGRGLEACDAWLEASGHEHGPRVAPAAQQIERERHEHVGIPEHARAGRWRQHTDDGVRHAVEQEALFEDIWARRELPLPELVRQQHHAGRIRASVFRPEAAAEHRRQTPQRRQIRRRAYRRDAHRELDAGEREGIGNISRLSSWFRHCQTAVFLHWRRQRDDLADLGGERELDLVVGSHRLETTINVAYSVTDAATWERETAALASAAARAPKASRVLVAHEHARRAAGRRAPSVSQSGAACVVMAGSRPRRDRRFVTASRDPPQDQGIVNGLGRARGRVRVLEAGNSRRSVSTGPTSLKTAQQSALTGQVQGAIIRALCLGAIHPCVQ